MAWISLHFADRELGVIGCNQRIIDNATYLCMVVLEPIRQHFNTCINIHDAYRDPGHNIRVGGKPTSYHLFNAGQAAADFDVDRYNYRTVFDWIRLQSKLPFDKLILESTPAGAPANLHIQVDRNVSPRRESYLGGTGDSSQYILVDTK